MKNLTQYKRRSVGQFKRRYGTTTIGSTAKKAPAFRVLDTQYILTRQFPKKRVLISRTTNKMLKSRSLKSQNKMLSSLITKLHKRSK